MDQDATWYGGRPGLGLGLGDVVLDGDPDPLKGAEPLPVFSPCLLIVY